MDNLHARIRRLWTGDTATTAELVLVSLGLNQAQRDGLRGTVESAVCLMVDEGDVTISN